jgi:hypothetical protein
MRSALFLLLRINAMWTLIGLAGLTAIYLIERRWPTPHPRQDHDWWATK